MSRPLVIVSNRGPLSFALDDDGKLVTRKGGGGLVTALGSAVAGTGATWIAGALSDADRVAADEGLVESGGFRLRLLTVERNLHGAFYDVIANGTLWYLYHGLYDLARRPRFDRRWREAWSAYESVNRLFAEAVVDGAPEGAVVLVHDYHLSLVGHRLAERRPDLVTVHFSHTPFCGPEAMRVLPDDVAHQLLEGMSGYGACGFHARRWAAGFEASCQEALGSSPPTFVAPAAPDEAEMEAVVASPVCADATRALEAEVGDRKFIVRVDRIELSKNLLRGFLAFEELLETRPEWKERVVFGAFVYPTREGLADYLAYRQEVEGLIGRINERWATPGWTPILYDASDDYSRSVAALRLYDLLLVNPIRDGLNLVAKEGPLVNERDGVLALSRDSGVWEELGSMALELNPFDVPGTAEVLHRGLCLSARQRRAHAAALRRAVGSRTPSDWLDDQLAAAR